MSGEALEAFSQKPGGFFDTGLSTSNPDFPIRASYMNPPNYTTRGLTYTLPGACVAYKDVNLLGECNTFKASYACEEGFDGQPVEVWIGDPNNGGTKVAEFVTEATAGYTEFEELIVPCSAPIPAGVYTVYLKFGGDADERKTCSIENIKFTYVDDID